MNQIRSRKTLSLNFRNNIKIYDLEDDFKIEQNKEIENTDEMHKINIAEIINEVNLVVANDLSDNLNPSEQNQNSNSIIESPSELIPHKALFKKTLSRIVFVQLIDSILSVDTLKNEISTNILLTKFSDLMTFIAENNDYECSFLQNKQLANNFIHDLFVTFNENYNQIEQSVKESCENHWTVYLNEAIYSSIVYSAISEFIYMEKKQSEKDYKKIILNEYLLVSEYFLNENEIKFVNGILNTIFYKNNEENVENNIESLKEENEEQNERIEEKILNQEVIAE